MFTYQKRVSMYPPWMWTWGVFNLSLCFFFLVILFWLGVFSHSDENNDVEMLHLMTCHVFCSNEMKCS